MLTGTLLTTSGGVSGLDLDGSSIDISGSLGMRFREVSPDSGEDTFHQAYIGEVVARSYIWKPWFGNWKGRLTSSWERNESTQETENKIVSGAGEINLFHLSHFPFAAYFDIKDSRVDDTDLLDPGSEERFTRYGIRQSYSPTSGGMNINLNLFHDEREDLITTDKEKSNRGILSGFLHRGPHRFNASLLANDRERLLVMDQHKDWQWDVTHSYNPGARFNLMTSVGASGSDSENGEGVSNSSQERLTSNLLWRAETRPISVNAGLFIKSQTTESEITGDRVEDETRGNLSVIYLPTDNWRLRAAAGARIRTGSVDEKQSFQSASADYSSRLIPLNGFNYSYSAGAGIANETKSNTDDERVVRTNVSHNLNRNWQHDWFGPIGASFTIGQDLIYEGSSIEEELGTLVHRLSYSLSSTGDSRSTNLNMVLYDSRNSGRNDFTTQNASISAIHNQRISRYSDLGASFNVNFTRQSGSLTTERLDDPFTESDESDVENGGYTSLEIYYHHNRLFKVRNLRFGSRLRASTDSLLFDDLGSEPSSEFFWENRIDYTIGKLDIDFRTTWVERPAVDDAGTKTIILSIRRLF